MMSVISFAHPNSSVILDVSLSLFVLNYYFQIGCAYTSSFNFNTGILKKLGETRHYLYM